MKSVPIAPEWEKRKEEGWVWKENHTMSDPSEISDLGLNNYARKKELEEEYGSENVATGNAAREVDSEMCPIGIPGQYGVYVRPES